MLLLPPPLINRVHCMDAIELMRLIPAQSVDLVLTDPPYNGVKDEEWDNQWKTDADYLAWLRLHLVEFRRVLKPNGSLYLFASPRMAARVEVLTGELFNVLTRITWRKPAYSTKAEMFDKDIMRAYFPASEAVIFAEQYMIDRTGLEELINDQELFTPIRHYFDCERKKLGHLSFAEINKLMGMAANGGGMASNILNPWKMNWTFPSEDTYELLSSATGCCQRPYNDLKHEYDNLRTKYEDLRREYEDLRRPFNVSADVPYTDVWDFPTVGTYPGKHPCEKPLAMMKHIVNASSKPGAVVLDPFCGSGSTIAAAHQLDRQYIGNDKDKRWATVAANRCVKQFGERKTVHAESIDSLPLFRGDKLYQPAGK